MPTPKIEYIEVNQKFTKKQWEAWGYLHDKTTKQVVYGGSAGNGKSYLLCVWITAMARKYPDTRYVIGRSVLKALKETTLVTLFKVFSDWNLLIDIDYTYNETNSIIKFKNGSVILLKDLADNPSDTDFESLGSLELTAAGIDEAGQVSQKAFDVLFSRIRYNLDRYKLTPKILLTCNPTKNFIYHNFYIPFKNGMLPSFRKFVPALPTDNQFIDSNYIQSLQLLEDQSLKERLLYGNWEYETYSNELVTYSKILNIFRNVTYPDDYEFKPVDNFITADIANSGRDKTIILVWHKFNVREVVILNKNTTPEAVKTIKDLATKYNVPASHIVVDKIGVGVGTYDMIPGCIGFVANAKAVNSDIYANLKAECGYKLAEMINNEEITMSNIDFDNKNDVTKEIENLKSDNKEDAKKNLIAKHIIKNIINRSPDWLDALMFRMVFTLKSVNYSQDLYIY